MSEGKRKKIVVSMQKRLEAIFRMDKGETLKSIAAEYGVGATTVGDWKKNRIKIEDFCSKMVAKDSLGDRSTARTAKNEALDESLFLWFRQERDRGVPISGPILQEKALSLNKKLGGDPSFTASSGWLTRWKERHGIRQLTVTGEILSGDVVGSENFKVTFKNLIAKHNLSPSQIYNADETGLFYKMLPTKSLASKVDDKAKGHKKSKDRVTLLCCSNASGEHKLPLMLIGKSAKPRALKNVHFESLPVLYRSQKKAWMNSDLFKNWFLNYFVPSVKKYLKDKMLPEKAMLLIDNAPTHPEEAVLKSGGIFVKFLPPNATSLIQPMDQGSIEALKRRYRKALLSELVREQDGSEKESIMDTLKKINIKSVIYNAAAAWDDVSNKTLQNSWKKLWPDIPINEDLSEEDDNDGRGGNREIREMLVEIEGCESMEDQEIADWLNVDQCDPGYQLLSEDEIVEEFSQPTPNENLSSDDEAEEDATINHTQAASMFDQLLTYLERQDDTSPAELLLTKRLRDRSAKKRTSAVKQKNIKDFFSKQ